MNRFLVLQSIGGLIGAAAFSTYPSESDAASACAVTPEGEQGPFFADDSAARFRRVSIRANLDGSRAQAGVPLTLTLRVAAAKNNCAAVAGAHVDIWHCNALGMYSDIDGQGTRGQQWLRGYQRANAAGIVMFRTIIPGWYQGRATHIHLRVRTATMDDTTQLFFPGDLTDAIYRNVAAYKPNGRSTTRNEDDNVFVEQTEGATLLDLTGSVHAGFAAATTLGLTG